MNHRLLTLRLSVEQDVVLARQRTRHIGQLLGYANQDLTRMVTAVSEIARNAFTYASGGTIKFSIEGAYPPQLLVVAVSDSGSGIANLDDILAGRYRSRTGMGMGLLGATRLMDHCDVQTGPQGTVVTMKKLLPRGAPLVGARQLDIISGALQAPASTDFEEVRQHNQELLQTLEELRQRQEQLLQMTAELEDTNRGVVALYAELDEQAGHLRRADDMKSRFLSNMSHEFRTPLSSIRALSRLLLNRIDGDLSPEQEKQVQLILRSAEDLSELVNDLLDLAKIEAGKTEIHAGAFDVGTVFSALRGMLRPLLVTPRVDLVFQADADLPALYGDEGKVSQILRNFISNALKFTERGVVEVSATLSDDGRSVHFRVRDTGIGIASEHLELVFEEFTQIESTLQKSVKGTGLGLPLCKKLAELMGGSVSADSRLGEGSVFTATIPVRYVDKDSALPFLSEMLPGRLDDDRPTVLIVDDDKTIQLLYEKYLQGSRYQAVCVGSITEARRALATLEPLAVVLDIALGGEDAWSFLGELKHPAAPRIPVIVATQDEDVRKGFALGADAYFVKPLEPEDLLSAIDALEFHGVPAALPPGARGNAGHPQRDLRE